MEAHTDADITSLSFAANWIISNGSLHSVINFKSSLNSRFDVDYYRKSPLILKPPSPDSFPCEIKINFSQKYEIRQLYVRSTANVYDIYYAPDVCEIYYAPDLERSNEYLCTVRCKTAVREEELINGNGNAEDDAHSKGQNGHLIGDDEDDWVVVNCPNSPTLDNTKNVKDFYEATAEITGAQPCMSLTLRFPSIENEGCLYIDEIYVFALPIEPTNNFTYNQMERLMEQLVVKVSNIEDLFLRFEENMVKPINRIEARLEQVEQQLKEISLNLENSKAKAPEYSEYQNSDQVLDEDYEDGEETHEGKGYYGILNGSKSIASGVQEPMITLTKFHFLMDLDGFDGDVSSDTVCGRLHDNRMYFNQQLFAFPREAVCLF